MVNLGGAAARERASMPRDGGGRGANSRIMLRASLDLSDREGGGAFQLLILCFNWVKTIEGETYHLHLQHIYLH